MTVPFALDLYFVGSGRAGITFTATGIGRPVDPTLERSLLEVVIGRVETTPDAPGS